MPQWMSPLQMILQSGEEGRKDAQSFLNARSQSESEQSTMDRQKQQQTSEMDRLKQQEQFQVDQLQAKQQRIATKLAPIAQAFQGVDSPEAAWNVVSQNPSWLVDPDTQKPVSNFLAAQNKVAQVENGSINTKLKIQDSTNFNKRLQAINPEDRAAINSMSKNKDGTPSAMAWQALSTAEQTMQVHKENLAGQAELEAMRRGDQETTTITDKGVTKRFTPHKADASAAAAPTEYETPFPDMPWIKVARVPGGKGLHIIRGDSPMTSAQRARTLGTLSKAYSSLKAAPKDSDESKTLQEQINVLRESVGFGSSNKTGASTGAQKGTAPQKRVTTQAQFDALKSGDTYIGEDGKTYQKP